MSLYALTSTPVRTIALSIFHQPAASSDREEYLAWLSEVRAQVHAEAGSMRTALQKSMRESATRQTLILRGLLSQFLQTPISSDDQEVRRLINESLEKFKAEILGDMAVGIRYVDEGRLVFPSLKRARDRKLLQNGRAYLQRAGFTTGKEKAELFESSFAVEGGTNLDLLDTILSRRVTPPNPFEPVLEGGTVHRSFGLYNLLCAHGGDPPAIASEQGTEGILLFSRPELMYASLRETILELVEKMATELMPGHVSAWQQKLGLGHGAEYLLRIVGGRTDVVSEAIHWLELHKGQDAVRGMIIDQGSLLVKDLAP